MPPSALAPRAPKFGSAARAIPPDSVAKSLYSVSCVSLAIATLQHHERLDVPCAQLANCRRPQPSPCQIPFDQPLALRSRQRPRTSRHRQPAPSPHHPLGPRHLDPPTPPFLFQPGFPARVALPTGLLGALYAECAMFTGL